jgi:hypothetical protein
VQGMREPAMSGVGDFNIAARKGRTIEQAEK